VPVAREQTHFEIHCKLHMAFVLGHSVFEGPVSSVLDATKNRYTVASVSETGAPSAPKSHEQRPLTCTSLCDLILLIHIWIWHATMHHGKEIKFPVTDFHSNGW